MTPEEVACIEETWQRVCATPEVVAALFYSRLFSTHPQLRPLFKGDLSEQGRKLMAAIGVVVASLRRPQLLHAAAEQLGRRHEGYGVRPEHYPAVGGALIWTLGKGLGAAFTPEIEKAWTQAFDVVASAMLRTGEP
jgi:nitric oxide dioxygenase